MSTLWSDDFESADALSVNYVNIIDAQRSAAVGVGGGGGVETTGTDQEKYFGEFAKNINAGGSRGGTAQVDINAVYRGNMPDSFELLRVSTSYFSFQYFLSLYQDVGASGLGLRVDYRDDVFAGVHTGSVFDGVITPGVFNTVKLSWCLSTIDPDTFVSNADGAVQVHVNGALVISLTDIHLTSWVNDNIWARVAVAPMGFVDNLLITDAGCSDTTVIVDETDLCCSDGKDVPSGGGTGAGAPPVLTAVIGTQIACSGGGLVPTQADLIYAENWWGQ